VWLSAHPSLVEKIALALLENGALDDRLHASPIIRDEIKTQKTLKREVTESASNSYRPDFALKHEDGSTTILEVKQVVDTDYAREFVEAQAREQSPHPAYSPSAKKGEPYARAGIFPWGKRGQKGPDGEKVVSARAIEHLRELSELASKSPDVHPAVLFICSRADAMGMRPNGAACPSFAKHLSRAQRKGVRVLVQKVRWGEGDDVGKAFDAGPLELWPALEEGDEFTVK
jgi:DNA-binding sugar fermentation-stimulating protein